MMAEKEDSAEASGGGEEGTKEKASRAEVIAQLTTNNAVSLDHILDAVVSWLPKTDKGKKEKELAGN